jgi:trimethylamine:corrinoid methyltransferase-like protein
LRDADAGFGNALQHHRLFGQWLAEGDARLDAEAHLLERDLRLADRAHEVMDAARTQSSLRDLEAAAFA